MGEKGKKRKKGKRGGIREEKKEIVVKKRENILILIFVQYRPYYRQKSPRKTEEFQKNYIIYTPAALNTLKPLINYH